MAYDEMSPGFSGRTSNNVKTKNKKVPMAIQFWALCDSYGFPVMLEAVLDKLAHGFVSIPLYFIVITLRYHSVYYLFIVECASKYNILFIVL
tara:strand:- start:1047 stop:1322 length:276 start_codon:yes stop_codon:yes gene_type:complete